jgi:hypothetical protein
MTYRKTDTQEHRRKITKGIIAAIAPKNQVIIPIIIQRNKQLLSSSCTFFIEMDYHRLQPTITNAYSLFAADIAV